MAGQAACKPPARPLLFGQLARLWISNSPRSFDLVALATEEPAVLIEFVIPDPIGNPEL